MNRPVDPISRALDVVRRQFALDDSGDVATYIPQLETVDPDLFGIALASMNGRVYSAGDSTHLFTIQSVSKPFVYALVLSELGLEETFSRVGAEPSGEAFNAISLEEGTGRPANPMVNAGAIVTTSLVAADNRVDRFEQIRQILSAFAGRDLGFDEAVFASELETGDMNRALAYLMKNAGSLKGDVDEALDVYFRQCSVLVNACDLAVMVATLANGGRNPITGKRVVSGQIAGHVLTVMATCGMYDFSGEWLLRVGLPAKSGVSGALIATSPGQFGIGLFSPRLDSRGNSVRAVNACRDLSERFELHLMNQGGVSVPVISHSEIWSSQWATPGLSDEDCRYLTEHAGRILLRGLQGEINFAGAEVVLRSFDEELNLAKQIRRWIVLDLHRVTGVHRAGGAVLEALIGDLAENSGQIVLVDAGDRQLLPGVPTFETVRDAFAWCEQELLSERHKVA